MHEKKQLTRNISYTTILIDANDLQQVEERL